jgi:hypothetical protein
MPSEKSTFPMVVEVAGSTIESSPSDVVEPLPEGPPTSELNEPVLRPVLGAGASFGIVKL